MGERPLTYITLLLEEIAFLTYEVKKLINRFSSYIKFLNNNYL